MVDFLLVLRPVCDWCIIRRRRHTVRPSGSAVRNGSVLPESETHAVSVVQGVAANRAVMTNLLMWPQPQSVSLSISVLVDRYWCRWWNEWSLMHSGPSCVWSCLWNGLFCCVYVRFGEREPTCSLPCPYSHNIQWMVVTVNILLNVFYWG